MKKEMKNAFSLQHIISFQQVFNIVININFYCHFEGAWNPIPINTG